MRPSINPKTTAAHYNWQVQQDLSDRFAETTDWNIIAAILKPFAKENNCLQILDLGCGTGRVAWELSGRGLTWENYIGIDLSELAIARFTERQVPGTIATVGEATDLSQHPDGAFDVVFCVFILQDLDRTTGEAFLKSLPRILRDKGALVLALTVDPESSRELGQDYKPQELESQGIPGKYTYLWSKPELEEALHESGFLLVEPMHQKNTYHPLIELYALYVLDKGEKI